MTTTRAYFVGGPMAGEYRDLEGEPMIVRGYGINYVPAVPLPEQEVTTETAIYQRTYAERAIDGVVAWRFEWRGWTGKADGPASE